MNNECNETVGQTVAKIQTSINSTVCIEDLLMKLAMAEAVTANVVDYADTLEKYSYASFVPPDKWAIAGMTQAFFEVSHALKCLCWGHQDALNH